MAEKAQACDDCGLLFDSTHAVQRYVKNWCPENVQHTKRKIEASDEPDSKRIKMYL